MIKQSYLKLVRTAADQIDFRKPADGPPPTRLRAFMVWALRGGWRVVWWGTLISILAGFTEVVSMFLLGRVVDAVDQTPSSEFLGTHLGLIIACVFILMVARPLLFGGLALTQSVMIGPNIGTQILARLFRWTLGQSVTYFDNDFAGRLAQKKLQAAGSLTEIVIESVNAITFGLATVLGTAFLLGSVNVWMVALLGLWFCLYLSFMRVMLPIVRKRSAARAEARAQQTGQIVDTISNIKTVKLFAGDEHEDGKAIAAMANVRDKAICFGEVQTVFRSGLIFIAGLLPVVLVGAAVTLRDTGVSPGDVAAIGAVSIRLSQMTGWISFTLMMIYSHLGEVEDGMKTLAPPHRIEDAVTASELSVKQAKIEYRDVTFAYGREAGGVANINLTIAPGEKLGIVGASGAGKSTLVSLLLRLYDVESGAVNIDGQNLSSVSQSSLRGQIGMVTQETAMFNRTARDNILYGNPNASEKAMLSAAEKAEAHAFIQDLEDHKGRTGYDAHLGERGVKLSGGQRQRIALARAILKDAPILVLDEATSALDSEVEASIQSALKRVMDGKTVLAIAHRLSTLTEMDRIIVMDAGRVVEEGSHTTLLAQNGLYAQYWKRQSGGFIRTEAAE